MDIESIKKTFKGELKEDPATRATFGEDMSIFKISPELVAFPKDAEDVKVLVRAVRDAKRKGDPISLTARAAGTDMTGGPLSESVVVSFTEHFDRIKEIRDTGSDGGYTVVEPGVYFRDLERELDARQLLYPPYPASKDLCALGGMVNNNSGGEKTLRYGKTEDYVEEVTLVMGDGEEHTFRPLKGDALKTKLAEQTYEGEIYRKLHALIEKHYDEIQAAKPKVSKNSAGYYLWNVWDRETGVFDITKLIVGSQGTFGLMTKAKLRLVRKEKYERLAVIFAKSLDPVPDLVRALLPLEPESIESYDDRTLSLALKFFPSLLKLMKGSLFTLALRFLPELFMVLRGGFPKMVMLVSVSGDDEKALEEKMQKLLTKAKEFPVQVRLITSAAEAEKYWTIRRQSFALIHSHAKGKYAAAFVDDIIVKPEHMPTFLPEVNAVLDEYKSKLIYTIAGHPGNGNFHIIPLMDLGDREVRAAIPAISEKIYDIVARYKGSITAEHNDGLVRTPYLGKMYSEAILRLFAETKRIFDPDGIFNPGKKTEGTLAYAMEHVREE